MSRDTFYDAETDSLFIKLAKGSYAASREVSPGVVIDFDASGQPIGIDLENASRLIHRNRFRWLANFRLSGILPRRRRVEPARVAAKLVRPRSQSKPQKRR